LNVRKHPSRFRRCLFSKPSPRAQAIESLKASHRAALTKLDVLFASLQHRAFSGELTRSASFPIPANSKARAVQSARAGC
jgi:hypothetical protein